MIFIELLVATIRNRGDIPPGIDNANIWKVFAKKRLTIKILKAFIPN